MSNSASVGQTPGVVMGEAHRRATRREDDASLQAILDVAVDGIVIIDERGIINTFNRAAEKMFGYERSEVLGRNVNVLMPTPVREEHDQFIGNYLATGRSKIIGIGREVIGLRKDGTTFPIDLSVSEARHGGSRTFTGIVRDISHRKQLEKAILEAGERQQRVLGEDLREGLCQELAGVAFLIGAMHRKLQAGELLTERATAEVGALLAESVKHARELARGLGPVDQLPNGLTAALQHLADETAKKLGVPCEFTCPRPLAMHDANVATQCYRIAEQCVKNACQMKAEKITIALVQRRGSTHLHVNCDHAPNVNPRAAKDDMVYGMLQHRARLIGGKITLRRRRGGMRITCKVPNLLQPA